MESNLYKVCQYIHLVTYQEFVFTQRGIRTKEESQATRTLSSIASIVIALHQYYYVNSSSSSDQFMSQENDETQGRKGEGREGGGEEEEEKRREGSQ